MGDWSNNLEYEHREYYGHFYDSDREEETEEEETDDLISRQAVLDELEKWDWQDLYLPIHFKQILDDVPSVENKGEWIPCSERVPKTSDDVLACDGVDVFVAWYATKGAWQGWNSHDKNYDKNTPIIAWMPLPEPYNPDMRGE